MIMKLSYKPLLCSKSSWQIKDTEDIRQLKTLSLLPIMLLSAISEHIELIQVKALHWVLN